MSAVLFVLGTSLLATNVARAHPSPHPVPIASEVVSWVQPGGIVDWDLRIQAFDHSEQQRPAQPSALPICWEEDLYDELLDLPGQAAVVWLRSREDGVTSDWVGPRLVSVPEPGVGAAVLLGAMGLAAAGARGRDLAGARRGTRPDRARPGRPPSVSDPQR